MSNDEDKTVYKAVVNMRPLSLHRRMEEQQGGRR
jgi:hypothetical protein